jgi:hypothetical protein
MALGTVAVISASRESKPVAATISSTSACVALLCRGANLQRKFNIPHTPARAAAATNTTAR